ncbi:MAG: lysophospholipid acyltransferase family protein [Candidatus Sumerlaeaceae bacterium]|nr:lysophospholipid acyltransferase family protein [Candidatus Sumerlaeaceae bacterium]
MELPDRESTRPARVRLVHRLEYGVWRLITLLLGSLSRRWAIRLADALGWLAYAVLRLRRREVEKNLEIAFGSRKTPQELRQIALRTYQNNLLTFFEFVQPHLLGPLRGGNFEPIVGYEHYTACKGAPAISLLAHFGNWEAVSQYALHEGVRFVAFVKLLHNPLIDREVTAIRRSMGVDILPVTASIKRAVDAVRQGKWLAVLGDQDARRRGIFVDFFGRPASTYEGAALFSWKLNLPILPMFCVREDGPLRKLRLHVMAPILPDPNAERDAEVRRLTEAHVRALEQMIERFPDNYFWFHRRWKTKPRRAESAADGDSSSAC